MSWVRLLHAVGVVIHIVDPKQASRFAESRGSSGAKDDARDARILVELARSPAHLPPAWTAPSEDARQLARALGRHESLTAKKTRETQQLRADLALTMPLVDQAIDAMDTKWARVLVRAIPTPHHAASLTNEALLALMKGAHRATIARVWAAIQSTDALAMTTAEAKAEADAVHDSLDRLDLLEVHLKKVDGVIEALLDAFAAAERIHDIPGFGTKLTAAVIAYGALDGDRDATAVRMGAAPVFRGSGRRADGSPKGVVKMRRAAPANARRAVYMLGRAAVGNLPWARAQFAASRARGKRAGTAYRHVVRSLLRLVSAIVRTGKAYDERAYVTSLKAHGVTWATALPT